jgi:ubiquinone/menaquinone biosynthesis C-methylase UbiE
MSSIYNKNYISTTYKDKKSSYPKKFCKQIFGKYPKTANILDLGCGNGHITEEIRQLGFDVTGVDINPPKGKHPLQYVTADITKQISVIKDNTFDIVFSKSVIEHLREPDHMVNEAYRILKPGGIFICMTPSYKHSYEESFYIDHTHYTPFTRYSLETICELSGFESSCKYLYQLPLIWKFPILHVLRRLLNILRLPYKPFSEWDWWSSEINKIIRFSKEPLLLCVANKPK